MGCAQPVSEEQWGRCQQIHRDALLIQGLDGGERPELLRFWGDGLTHFSERLQNKL